MPRSDLTPPPLTRDRATWLGYVLIGLYAYLQASLGPVMPFLQSELGFDYTTGGFHFSALAVGVILNGLTADRVVRRLGRQRTLWTGAAGVVAGASLLTASPVAALTMGSAFLMGYSGSLMGVSVIAYLSDRHGSARTMALLELTITGSVFAALAPVSVGLWQEAGGGWRAAMWLAVAGLVGLALRFIRTPAPERQISHSSPAERSARLPGLFWVYWIVIVLSVAAEWSVIFWGSAFLQEVGRLNKSTAAASMSFFLGAMLLGRIVGSRLARFHAADRLLVGASLLAVLGFTLFWLHPHLPWRLVGLSVLGLGIANLYPLTVSTALSIVPDRSEQAGARLSLGSGVAVFSAPLLLGWAADSFSVWQAYGIVAVLLALIVATLGALYGAPRRVLAFRWARTPR